MIDFEEGIRLFLQFEKEYPEKKYSTRFITGSLIINGKGNDVDICILLKKGDEKKFLEDGFIACAGIVYEGSDFLAFRKGKINLICLFKKEVFLNWKLATMVASEVRDSLKSDIDKNTRVGIFKVIERGASL